ncbi:MAG: hypothetical protein GY714_22175 [Desulfobacterales bacterium]|nr:hypothetical protein [Desulfobacterales bacterium]MCP4158769.1 hypothetical protein [Deltaproteobacteria bacterium]
MKIRMEISDELYLKYKKMAEQEGYAVTKLNQIIFEQAVGKWVIENELKNIDICQRCGSKVGLLSKKNGFYDGEKMHAVCVECFENLSEDLTFGKKS